MISCVPPNLFIVETSQNGGKILKSDNIIFSFLIINSQMQPGKKDEGLRGMVKTDSIGAIEPLSLSRARNLSENMGVLGMLAARVSSEHPDLFAGLSNTPVIPMRQESSGNIFAGFHHDDPVKPTPMRDNLTHTYEMECLEYEKYLFDNRIRLIIKKMSVHAYNIYRNEK